MSICDLTMQRKSVFNCIVKALAMLIFSAASAVSAAQDISGTWLHADKPASIRINLDTGIASVGHHEHNPEAVGLTVIKSLKVANEGGRWDGEMFNGYKGQYDPVVVTLSSPTELVVYDHNNQPVLKLWRQ